MLSSVPEKGDALAVTQAGDRLAGEQPCGKHPGGAGGQSWAWGSDSRDDHQYPRLYKQEHGKATGRSDCSPFTSP